MDGFSLQTPEQVSKTLAARLKALRLARGWKQATLAERSGVSLASLRRFEASGRASLQHLLALASLPDRTPPAGPNDPPAPIPTIDPERFEDFEGFRETTLWG